MVDVGSNVDPGGGEDERRESLKLRDVEVGRIPIVRGVGGREVDTCCDKEMLYRLVPRNTTTTTMYKCE